MMTKSKALISIIIRTKNEERWISHCLKAVFSQNYRNFEVILVDNNSSDQTVNKAKEYPVKVVKISNFKPGRAINEGIRASSGEIIVCLSGHCIPTCNTWLENLTMGINHRDVAGVYGRQEPLSFSSDLDKRDLLIVFGLDKKIQIKDPFFHNANSAFLRETWKKYPFDEDVTNIEDRVWGQTVINAGMKIVYEPSASVYHWHGIHHSMDKDRARNIVRILENMGGIQNDTLDSTKYQEIIGVIPIRGETLYYNNKSLLELTIRFGQSSRYINRIIVLTDNLKTANLAQSLGAEVPFIRPINLSEDYIDVAQVLQYSLSEIEKDSPPPDLIVLLEESYPFRQIDVVDSAIKRLHIEGLDSIMAVRKENRTLLRQSDERFEILGDGFMPRDIKENVNMIGLIGYATILQPRLLRDGKLYGERLGIFEIDDIISSIQIRDENMLSKLMEAYNYDI